MVPPENCCVICGIYLGLSNPRQLCKKTFCGTFPTVKYNK